jgi:hypothetical protein
MIPMIVAERCPSCVKLSAERLIQLGGIYETLSLRADLLCRPFGAGEVMSRDFVPFAEALPWPVMPRRFQERFRSAATHCAGSLMLPLLQDSSRADWWNRSSAVSHKFAARVCKEQPQVFRLRLAGKRQTPLKMTTQVKCRLLETEDSWNGDGGNRDAIARRQREGRCAGTTTGAIAMRLHGDKGKGDALERRRGQSRCDCTATEGVATEGVATEGTVTEGRAPRARTLIRTLRG